MSIKPILHEIVSPTGAKTTFTAKVDSSDELCIVFDDGQICKVADAYDVDTFCSILKDAVLAWEES